MVGGWWWRGVVVAPLRGPRPAGRVGWAMRVAAGAEGRERERENGSTRKRERERQEQEGRASACGAGGGARATYSTLSWARLGQLLATAIIDSSLRLGQYLHVSVVEEWRDGGGGWW